MSRKKITLMIISIIVGACVLTSGTYLVAREGQDFPCLGGSANPGPLDEPAATRKQQSFHGFPQWFYKPKVPGGCLILDPAVSREEANGSTFRPSAFIIDFVFWAIILTAVVGATIVGPAVKRRRAK